MLCNSWNNAKKCLNYGKPFPPLSGRRLWIYGQLSAALRVAHIPTALLLLLLKYFKKNKTKGLIKIRFLIKRG